MPRTTWSQVTLYNYRLQLSQIIKVEEERQSSIKFYWNVAARIGAAVGLIGLMAIFPFGELAAPSLVLLLEFAGGTGAILGILTMLNETFFALEKLGDLNAKAREKLFRLGQTDPTALYELGVLLSQSKALCTALIKGALVLILTMPLARLRVAAAALNFQGYVQDVETLFEEGEADGDKAQSR